MLTIATRRAAACLSFKLQAARAIQLSSPILSTFDDMSRNDPPKIIEKHERAEHKRQKPSNKLVCGIGVNDRAGEISKSTLTSYIYSRWRSMLYRCYSGKCPGYEGVTVCEEWLTFSNFEKWMKEQMKYIDLSDRQLDKDVLVPGNKVYSRKTCHFVPRRVNCMFRSDGVDSEAKGERMMEMSYEMNNPYDSKVAQVLLSQGRAMVQRCAG